MLVSRRDARKVEKQGNPYSVYRVLAHQENLENLTADAADAVWIVVVVVCASESPQPMGSRAYHKTQHLKSIS